MSGFAADWVARQVGYFVDLVIFPCARYGADGHSTNGEVGTSSYSFQRESGFVLLIPDSGSRLIFKTSTNMAKDTTGRLHVTVKTGGKRKLSSKLWLERQLNDPYVAQAKRDGYRSRAAYKLIEIDDKYHFLKHGIAVVDLGAAPGGWSQIAAKRVGAVNGKGKVVAIDLLEMPEVPGVNFAQLDFLSEDAPEKLIAMMGGRADVVMSDMAPNTTGHRKTDQLRIVGLIETAAAFATDVLNPGGTFLAKAFQSGADAELVAQLKRDFASVRHVKPASSRQDSSERYVLAMGFRGQPKRL
jgi:23S rRNA (uridine2552-2'-O)-methyltransferase